MIKAVFFDFDGVLTLHPSGYFSTCSYLARATGRPLDKLIQSYHIDHDQRNLGKLPAEAAWDSFWRQSGIHKNLELLTEAFLSTPKNEAIFELAKKLKNSGYATGIITDNNILRWELLEKAWRLKKIFGLIILSARVGLSKYSNGAKIFELALKTAKLRPAETVFIDNSEKYVETAKSLGIRGIYFDEKQNNLAGLRQTLIKLGVKLSGRT